jgi:hypothetical protein
MNKSAASIRSGWLIVGPSLSKGGRNFFIIICNNRMCYFLDFCLSPEWICVMISSFATPVSFCLALILFWIKKWPNVVVCLPFGLFSWILDFFGPRLFATKVFTSSLF